MGSMPPASPPAAFPPPPPLASPYASLGPQPPGLPGESAAGGGFFARVFGANFNRIEPSWSEQRALAAAQPPITDPLSQKYLCWRRAMLWVAFGLLTLSTAEETIGTVIDYSKISSQDAPFSTGFYVVMWMYYLVKFAACGLIAFAAGAWSSFGKSVQLARWGWLTLFMVIFAQAVVPLVAFLDFGDQLAPDEEAALSALMGTIATFTAFIYLVPAAFAILPGLIRASLTLKTLFPQSAGPGWLLVIAVPIYCAWRLAFALAVNQAGVFPLLGLGAVVFALGPAAFLFFPLLRRRLSRAEAGAAVTRARSAALITVAVGLLLILLFFAVHQRGVNRLMEGLETLVRNMTGKDFEIPVGSMLWSLATFILHVVAVASAVAVVAADCYVTAAARGRALLEDPREKQLANQHEEELSAMRELARLPHV
jgi:hypothetical protein